MGTVGGMPEVPVTTKMGDLEPNRGRVVREGGMGFGIMVWLKQEDGFVFHNILHFES